MLKVFLSLLLLVNLLFLVSSCNATREFWRYVVEDEVSKPLESRQQGEQDAPRVLSPHNVKVVYNDGSTVTEVLIPVLASGQQILIDHQSRSAGSALSIVPLPPGEADHSVEQAYIQEGHPVVQAAPAVSIVQTHAMIRDLVQQGNLALALEYAEQLLRRYPSHVRTLRSKGSILLRLGERQAALATYYRAQEIEFDASVQQQITNLERSINE